MASCSNENEADGDLSLWKCPLCLDKYKNPKLLPCSHTFCKVCLMDLLNHQTGRPAQFSCPSCREMIQVPSGGVDAFKNNYYLDAANSKEKRQLLCKVHPSTPRELLMFCHQCDVYICLACKMEDHSDHHTEAIVQISKTMKAKMTNDIFGLTGTISGVKRQLTALSAEQKTVRDKKTAVERDIRDLHRMMVSMVDKCRDDALFSLDTITASIDSQLDGVVNNTQKTLDELDRLKKRMENCLKGEEGSGMLATAQDIYEDASGHENEVQQLLASKISIVSRPVHHSHATADLILSTERRLLGSVERADIPVSDVEVTVQKMFSCCSAWEAHGVYSLFPALDNKVWIVFEDTAAKSPQLFTFTGSPTRVDTSVKDRTNYTQTSQGTEMCIVQTPDSFQTYAKSRSLLKLKNYLEGTGIVLEVIVETDNPLETSVAPRFSIRCGPHRAFDVHENKVLCAVVEEAQHPESQRNVRIYQQPTETAAATYCSPIQPFQPSDVCFYKLWGHHVLLVADELNDLIHVVQLETGQLEFGGYLAAGNPLITQPTALNTDVNGRLWIACRSGDVLMC